VDRRDGAVQFCRSKALAECSHEIARSGLVKPADQADFRQPFLRAQDAQVRRPCPCGSTDSRNEIALSHSITSSARKSTEGGMVRVERLCGSEVHHQLELRRLLDR